MTRPKLLWTVVVHSSYSFPSSHRTSRHLCYGLQETCRKVHNDLLYADNIFVFPNLSDTNVSASSLRGPRCPRQQHLLSHLQQRRAPVDRLLRQQEPQRSFWADLPRLKSLDTETGGRLNPLLL